MSPSTLKWVVALLAPICIIPAYADLEGHAEPDSILLNDGKTVHGVIVRNTADAVWIQNKYTIRKYDKSWIVRIKDEADEGIEFTDANRRGDLPSWRVMVNDLRNNDAIKVLEQIPATVIDNGIFKNVPYLSFRINEYIEMNIYGDPDDPAAIELGVYGKYSSRDKIRRVLRSFLAGFLSSRKEVAAIYSIPFSGGKECLGDFCIQIMPKTAPDAYGAWWISLYNPKTLAAARLNDAEYAKLTKPPEQVVSKSGRVKHGNWTSEDLGMSARLKKGNADAPVLIRGFFRDATGQFRALAYNNSQDK
jgi:hypothetical protein